MKKLFLSLYILLIINLGFGMNIDYGASIDSFLGFHISDSSYMFGYQKVSIYSSLDITNSVSFAVDGFYKLSYSSESSSTVKNVFDLSTLLISFPVKNMSLNIGRDYISDYSGDILNHVLDGISLSLALGPGVLNTHILLSSLINDNEVSLFTTSNDDGDVSRVIEGVDYIKEFDSMTIWASLYSSQDVNSFVNFALYLGGGVSGTIKDDIFYSFRSNLLTGQFFYLDSITTEDKGAPLLAGMGVISTTWFMNFDNEIIRRLSPFITVDFGMSSGDSKLNTQTLGANQGDISISDGVHLYSPLTTGGPGTIYSINNQNLTYFKIQNSVSPMENIQAQLGSTIFFRTVDGVISDEDLKSNTSGNYLGLEVSLVGNYRPFSDLGVSVSGGVFFPNKAVLDSSVSGMLAAYLSLSI